MTALFYNLIECNPKRYACYKENPYLSPVILIQSAAGCKVRGVEGYKWWHFDLNKLRLKSVTYTPMHPPPFHFGVPPRGAEGLLSSDQQLHNLESEIFLFGFPPHSDEKPCNMRHAVPRDYHHLHGAQDSQSFYQHHCCTLMTCKTIKLTLKTSSIQRLLIKRTMHSQNVRVYKLKALCNLIKIMSVY